MSPARDAAARHADGVADLVRTPWLRDFGAAPRPSALTLVVFPHAGGGAGFYRPLAEAFPPWIDVRVVQYPGRETRVGEPLVGDMRVLADRAADALAPLLGPSLDRPVAVFGHSMGAIVGYEVTRRLESLGAAPVRLFASARHPPVAHVGDRMVHLLDEDAFVRVLRETGGTPAALLDDAEMRAYLLPIVRNDYRLIETYVPSPGPPLRTGIVSIAADDDLTVSAGQIEGWRRATSGPFEHLAFPGGHFYLFQERAALVRAVLDRLGRHGADPGAERTGERSAEPVARGTQGS